MQRIGGFRRKTRSKLRKPVSERGKISIRKYLQVFKVGDKVSFKADPSVQTGMYLPRFHGHVGTVTGKQGICYKVEFYDRRKKKEVIVHPVHLGRMK